MMPIRTILHPTDFSSPSEAALELACSLARSQGARLVILHVTPYAFDASARMATPMDPCYYRDALSELLVRIVGASPGFAVESCLREGSPAAEILRAADDIDAGLIVMGSHGRTGLGRLLMGSVAEAVMRRACCPVLLAKRPADTLHGKAAHGDATQVAGRVLVTEGRCDCGVHNAHVVHRDFPEYWAEGGTAAEGIARLERTLLQAREGCPSGWHYDDLSRAIEEVRAFDALTSLAGKPRAAMSEVKAV